MADRAPDRADDAAIQETVDYGLYQDRYEKHDGRWWFANRQYSSLARTAADTEVFPLPDIA